MKYRIGFVTNSSSSSYLCVICDKIHSGYDATLDDAEMLQCVNNHTFCESHVSDAKKVEMVIAALESIIETRKANAWGDADDEELLDNIKSADGETAVALANNALRDGEFEIDTSIPETHCPVCTFAYLTNEDLARYLVSKYGLSRTELRKEIQDAHKTYTAFLEKTDETKPRKKEKR